MRERDFWEAIGRASNENEEKTVCLALSDWLEENSQPEKAEWIRACIKDKAHPWYDAEMAPVLWFSYPIGGSWWHSREKRGRWRLRPLINNRCKGFCFYDPTCQGCGEQVEDSSTDEPSPPSVFLADDVPF